MHYIVDGHNLIGQSRTIALDDPDDEAQLVAMLHRWVLRHERVRITVVFDGGIYGHPHDLSRPSVRVLFAHSPRDADARIIQLIHAVDEPGRYCVVTSDRAVAGEAAARGIRVLDSARFSAELEQPESSKRRAPARLPSPEPKLPRAEVDDWLRIFGADRSAED